MVDGVDEEIVNDQLLLEGWRHLDDHVISLLMMEFEFLLWKESQRSWRSFCETDDFEKVKCFPDLLLCKNYSLFCHSCTKSPNAKYEETLPFFVLNPTLEDFFLIAGDQLQWVDKARSPAQKQNSE